MINPTVSVVIPTWNRAHSIEAAISSALKQTLAPMEVLVCDDGSTDNTKERVGAMGDPRIRWLPGSRGGCPAIPRNRGIKEARGDWLAFLDSDDEWLPEKLERQFEAAGVSGTDAVCSNTWRSVPGESKKSMLLPAKNKILGWKDLLQRNQVHCSSVLVRRSLFNIVEGFPETPNLKVGEDYALWIRISVLTNFTYLGEPLLVYLDDPENSVRADSVDEWKQRIWVFSDFLDWCSGKQELSNRAACTMARQQIRKAYLLRFLSKAINLVRQRHVP